MARPSSFRFLLACYREILAPYLFIIALDYALRRAINGKEEQLGFTVIPRKSRRVGPTMNTIQYNEKFALKN